MKIELLEVAGFEPAFAGIRNSWNSHDQASPEADRKLAKKLIKAGPSHRKFLRMIMVWADIKAPLYWWKQFDTYKIGTVANSESTMHCIMDKEFDIDDFEIELGMPIPTFLLPNGEYAEIWFYMIFGLNGLRKDYIDAKNGKRFFAPDGREFTAEEIWNSLIKLLPESYLQKRTVCLNYEVLRTIYHQRAGHKLKEWQQFREWCETLPGSWMITEPFAKEFKGFEVFFKDSGESASLDDDFYLDEEGNLFCKNFAIIDGQDQLDLSFCPEGYEVRLK